MDVRKLRKSVWGYGNNGIREVQEGWIKGRFIPNMANVKEFDTGKVIGDDGETTKVRIYMNKDGSIFGHPKMYYIEEDEYESK